MKNAKVWFSADFWEPSDRGAVNGTSHYGYGESRYNNAGMTGFNAARPQASGNYAFGDETFDARKRYSSMRLK